MAIVTWSELDQYLRLSGATDEQADVTRLAAAAQGMIERMLGFAIEETYGGEDQDAVPEALKQAVCMLVTHWFAQREAATEPELAEVPFGVREIVTEFREFTF